MRKKRKKRFFTSMLQTTVGLHDVILIYFCVIKYYWSWWAPY